MAGGAGPSDSQQCEYIQRYVGAQVVSQDVGMPLHAEPWQQRSLTTSVTAWNWALSHDCAANQPRVRAARYKAGHMAAQATDARQGEDEVSVQDAEAAPELGSKEAVGARTDWARAPPSATRVSRKARMLLAAAVRRPPFSGQEGARTEEGSQR